MTLHDLYDVLDDRDAISVVQLVKGKKDYEVYCGFVMDFPYRLMRDYGSRNVLQVGHDNDVYLPQGDITVCGIRVLISQDEQEDDE